MTFAPSVRGNLSAYVAISDNSIDSPQQVSLSGTGFTGTKVIASAHSALTGTTLATAPNPTGPYRVGTSVLALTDSMRNDPYLANGPKRELGVRLWYPASLSDEVWLIRDAIMTGSMGPERAIAAIRDYIAAFLDRNLLGKPLDPLLAGTSSEYPDAEVTTQNELLRGKP